MSAFKEIAGQRFDRLLVIGLHSKERRDGTHWATKWLCECDCGKRIAVEGYQLRSGETRSCGCRGAENRRLSVLKHGKSRTPTYQIWCAMRTRCNNPRSTGFPWYGARGIAVCERWNDFAAFLADMGERPSGYSIERLDNDGPYAPSNCEWIPIGAQQKNKRRRGGEGG
jgi:hypothetical protein